MKTTINNIKCDGKLVKLKELKPHPKNPNTHSKDQIERLAKLIEYQGQRRPIIVSSLSGHIVAGHGTLEAIKKLGWKDCAVSYQDFENEEQEYAFIVSDNAIQEWSDLDLAGINLEIQNLGPDIDVEMLGLKNFSIVPEGSFEEEKENKNKSGFILEITFSNKDEAMESYDKFLSEGYIVRLK
jgi:hypothetical protein